MVNALSGILSHALSRVRKHPRPWILRYCVSFIPAVLLALTMTFLASQSFPQPFINAVIDQRDIDFFLDALMNVGDSNNYLLLLVVLAVVACLVWLPVKITFLWLEGGTLCSYTSEKPCSWKDFFDACNQWFWFMLLCQCLSALFIPSIAIATVLLGLAARALWSPLMWLMIGCGILLIVCISMGFEVVRAIAVTRSDRHLGHVVRDSASLIFRQPLVLSAFLFVALASMAVLLGFQRWITFVMPVSAWLLNFVVLQILAFARHGIRLFRLSGEIVIMQAYHE